jgi:hypothetical protein
VAVVTATTTTAIRMKFKLELRRRLPTKASSAIGQHSGNGLRPASPKTPNAFAPPNRPLARPDGSLSGATAFVLLARG